MCLIIRSLTRAPGDHPVKEVPDAPHFEKRARPFSG
jgi:hypothetical protein